MKQQKRRLLILLIPGVFLSFSSFASLNEIAFSVNLTGVTSHECTNTPGHECYVNIKMYLRGGITDTTLVHFYPPQYNGQVSLNGTINPPNFLEKTGIKDLYVYGQPVKLDTALCEFKQGVKNIQVNYVKSTNSASCKVYY